MYDMGGEESVRSRQFTREREEMMCIGRNDEGDLLPLPDDARSDAFAFCISTVVYVHTVG